MLLFSKDDRLWKQTELRQSVSRSVDDKNRHQTLIIGQHCFIIAFNLPVDSETLVQRLHTLIDPLSCSEGLFKCFLRFLSFFQTHPMGSIPNKIKTLNLDECGKLFLVCLRQVLHSPSPKSIFPDNI